MRPLRWLAALVLAAPAGAVTLDWSQVPLPLDVPNPPDTAIMVDGSTGYGSLPYAYEIALFEVTNAQYAEFLSAVAASDPHDVYDLRMGSDEAVGGITRSGDPGSRRYAAKPGFESKPVVYVTFYDALRFANWLHNEQPVGAQGPATTEDGAYTLAFDGVDSDGDEFDEDFVVRNAGARVFLTSEDEWYKAAYYDLGVGGYYDYPAGSGRQPECKRPTPPSTYDAANCGAHTAPEPVGGLTDVGAYGYSPGPFYTFDQGGNVEEWNEAFDEPSYVDFFVRGVRGGSWSEVPEELAAVARRHSRPEYARENRGFRVARAMPEPGRAWLLATGAFLLTARRLGLWHRRPR